MASVSNLNDTALKSNDHPDGHNLDGTCRRYEQQNHPALERVVLLSTSRGVVLNAMATNAWTTLEIIGTSRQWPPWSPTALMPYSYCHDSTF